MKWKLFGTKNAGSPDESVEHIHDVPGDPDRIQLVRRKWTDPDGVEMESIDVHDCEDDSLISSTPPLRRTDPYIDWIGRKVSTDDE